MTDTANITLEAAEAAYHAAIEAKVAADEAATAAHTAVRDAWEVLKEVNDRVIAEANAPEPGLVSGTSEVQIAIHPTVAVAGETLQADEQVDPAPADDAPQS